MEIDGNLDGINASQGTITYHPPKNDGILSRWWFSELPVWWEMLIPWEGRWNRWKHMMDWMEIDEIGTRRRDIWVQNWRPEIEVNGLICEARELSKQMGELLMLRQGLLFTTFRFCGHIDCLSHVIISQVWCEFTHRYPWHPWHLLGWGVYWFDAQVVHLCILVVDDFYHTCVYIIYIMQQVHLRRKTVVVQYCALRFTVGCFWSNIHVFYVSGF